MTKGNILKVFSISALALSALLLATPVLALTSEEQANTELAHQLYQQAWFNGYGIEKSL